MKLLVTGCAGFIGYHTTKQLLASGYQVVGLDNLNSYYDVRLKRYRLEDLSQNDNFTFSEVDIENASDLDHLFGREKNFEVIFNLAARAGVRSSIESPHIYFSTNTIGTLNLLQLAHKYNTPKFVLASTSSLYAGQTPPFKETLAVNTPISPYAASKKAAEVLAYTYHYLNNLDVSVVRYFTVYGPAGRPDMCIFRFIYWIANNIPIQLSGDGTQSRDFTFVGDIASGTIAASKKLGYEIINLGGGQSPTSLLHVIQDIENLLGKKAIIEHTPFHRADIKDTQADINKAKELLAWSPQTSFPAGLAQTVDWYLQNRSFCDAIKLPL